jgi:hypothetical protein
MAVKACRSLTLILLLSLSVVASTATVGISTVYAASSSGSGTCGDPDSPKDTGPRPAAAPSSTPVSVSSTLVGTSSAMTTAQAARWMLVQQLLSSLLGRPGLLR